jgi:hypothetical protein
MRNKHWVRLLAYVTGSVMRAGLAKRTHPLHSPSVRREGHHPLRSLLQDPVRRTFLRRPQSVLDLSHAQLTAHGDFRCFDSIGTLRSSTTAMQQASFTRNNTRENILAGPNQIAHDSRPLCERKHHLNLMPRAAFYRARKFTDRPIRAELNKADSQNPC